MLGGFDTNYVKSMIDSVCSDELRFKYDEKYDLRVFFDSVISAKCVWAPLEKFLYCV